MTFSGTPVVREITDGLVRVTGVSLDGGATGTIGLSDSIIPFAGAPPDIQLPQPFRPRVYEFLLHDRVTLQDSVQVQNILQFTPQDAFVFLATLKSGATPVDFLITVANMSGSASSFLGAARPFCCVARGSVINVSGGTTLTGDVAAVTGAVTGFPPGTISGSTHVGDATAIAALRDSAIAFEALGAMTSTTTLTGDLGGLSLSPGIYRIEGNATLDGTLTLDSHGEFNAFWVFQVTGDFDMAANAVMALASGAEANTVFWVIDGDAEFGTTAQARGTFIATGEVVHQSSTLVEGRYIALTGDVSITDATVTVPGLPSGFFPANSGPLEIYIRYH